jgi:RNA polymerase sigma-70 factor (ECF subfamily)
MAAPRLVRLPDPPPDALQQRPDDELMVLACAGLRDAFAVLVQRHAERVVNACARFLKDAHVGREIAQDTWILVWQARATYRGGGGFVPWLITIARNRCRNELRRRKLASEHQREPQSIAPGSSPEQLDSMLTEERRRRVRSALANLSEPHREAVLLRYAEGLRYDEMTGMLGVGEGTLRSRVHYGLKALKLKLEADS